MTSFGPKLKVRKKAKKKRLEIGIVTGKMKAMTQVSQRDLVATSALSLSLLTTTTSNLTNA
jgi:hypothetical protein